MAKEICISSTPHETRLAILEDDQLAEIYYERENEYTLAGSVYKGRVTRVLPGMQSAFVDIGLERDAFLYVTDFLEMEDQEDTDEVERAASQGDTNRPKQAAPVAQQAVQAPRPSRGEDRGDRVNGGRDGRPRRGDPQFVPSTPIEAEPVVAPFGEPSTFGSAVETTGQTAPQSETEEQGARRLRGRRRRRGGRGRDEAGHAGFSSQAGGEPSGEISADAEQDEDETPLLEFEASAASAFVEPVARSFQPAQEKPRFTEQSAGSAAPTPFLLPGESLSTDGANAEPVDLERVACGYF